MLVLHVSVSVNKMKSIEVTSTATTILLLALYARFMNPTFLEAWYGTQKPKCSNESYKGRQH
jgi:hypothetical protein